MSEPVPRVTGSTVGSPPPEDPPPWWMRLWLALCALVLDVWLSIRALGRVLWLCRFSVAPLLIGAYALLLNDQAQEVLREFAARGGWWDNLLEFTVFAAVFLLWALNTWLCARLLTELFLPESPALLPHELFYRIWVPRALGALAALVVPVAILIAAQSYVGRTTSEASVTQMRILAGALFVVAGVFIAYIVFRSHLRIRMLGGGQDTRTLALGTRTIRLLHPFDKTVFVLTVVVTLATFFHFWLGTRCLFPSACWAWMFSNSRRSERRRFSCWRSRRGFPSAACWSTGRR